MEAEIAMQGRNLSVSDILGITCAHLEELGHVAEFSEELGAADYSKYRIRTITVNGIQIGLRAYKSRADKRWYVRIRAVATRYNWVARGLRDGAEVAKRLARDIVENLGDVAAEVSRNEQAERARRETNAALNRCRDAGVNAASNTYHDSVNPEVRVYLGLMYSCEAIVLAASRVTDEFLADVRQLASQQKALISDFRARYNQEGGSA